MYLDQSLRYYADCDIPIVVTDSSDNQFQPAAELKGVTYLHHKGLPFINKLWKAINTIDTPYVVLRADNRHTSCEAILKCVQFLESNKDYSSAHGLYLTVEEHGDDLIVSQSYHEDNQAGVVAETPEARLAQLFTPYVATAYSVQRIESWRDALGILAGSITNYTLLELLHAMVVIINGKHKTLPFFYCAKHVIPNLRNKTPEYDGMEVVIAHPKYATEYSYFIQSLATYLARKAHIGEDQARAHILEAVDSYIGRYCLPKAKKTLLYKMTKIYNKAKALLSAQEGTARQGPPTLLERKLAGERLVSSLDAESRQEVERVLEVMERTREARKQGAR